MNRLMNILSFVALAFCLNAGAQQATPPDKAPAAAATQTATTGGTADAKTAAASATVTTPPSTATATTTSDLSAAIASTKGKVDSAVASALNNEISTKINPDMNIRTNIDNWQCVLYLGSFDWLTLTVVINTLSTWRLQNCSPRGLDGVTTASAIAQLRSVSNFNFINKGGAHQILADVNLTPVLSEYYNVSNLKFAPSGRVSMSLAKIWSKTHFLASINSVDNAHYETFNYVSRTYYIWNIGSLVHRLVKPNGDTYIMYSYTQDVAPELTRDKLVDLGTRLKLPYGWKYESYLLDETVTIRGDMAGAGLEVLFDDLRNNYTRYTQ